MGDQITDYGKESEGTSEDLLRNQKINLCIKLYGTATRFCVYEMKVYGGKMPSLWSKIQLHNFCRML